MELVAFVGEDKETHGQIVGLVKKGDWEKVILVGEGIPGIDGEVIKVDRNVRLADMKNDLLKKLKGKISGIEVALSIASGNGKEHMALISALISIPVGIRFTALTRDGVIDL